MPAINMPNAADVAAPIPANPSSGAGVIMDPFSGPKGSPFDAKRYNPTTRVLEDDPTNYSTGASVTGIGCGFGVVIDPVAPESVEAAGFGVGVVPGETMPDGTSSVGAVLVAIGGGSSGAAVNGAAPTTPLASEPLYGFGNGISRDLGAGPAFVGNGLRVATATADTANLDALTPQTTNASGAVVRTGYSAMGSITPP